MGGTKCVVPGCTENTSRKPNQKPLSFHKFPSSPLFFEKWLLACKNEKLLTKPPEVVRKNAKVCANHFTIESYNSRVRRTSLRWDAVPTLLLPDVQQSSLDHLDQGLQEVDTPAGFPTAPLNASPPEQESNRMIIEKKTESDMPSCLNLSTPHLHNPNLDNPNLDNPNLDNPTLHNPNLDDPNLDNPNLDNPNLDNPILDNPNFDNPNMDNPNLDNSNLDYPNFDEPDLNNPHKNTPNLDIAHFNNFMNTPNLNSSKLDRSVQDVFDSHDEFDPNIEITGLDQQKTGVGKKPKKFLKVPRVPDSQKTPLVKHLLTLAKTNCNRARRLKYLYKKKCEEVRVLTKRMEENALLILKEKVSPSLYKMLEGQLKVPPQ
ncbi:hypothetical protein KUF71_001515 [Frankliniella fusca]|uniref:THAP-type domain-containing protein n=1 Tax=Frankliniella fusca TaxID=407009 RepID=A0AAE1LLE8_9NEOP|nr:hypothetical protein KUF71_001515 [Frankliniella fusca]